MLHERNKKPFSQGRSAAGKKEKLFAREGHHGRLYGRRWGGGTASHHCETADTAGEKSNTCTGGGSQSYIHLSCSKKKKRGSGSGGPKREKKNRSRLPNAQEQKPNGTGFGVAVEKGAVKGRSARGPSGSIQGEKITPRNCVKPGGETKQLLVPAHAKSSNSSRKKKEIEDWEKKRPGNSWETFQTVGEKKRRVDKKFVTGGGTFESEKRHRESRLRKRIGGAQAFQTIK